MKIEFEDDWKKVAFEINDDLNISELMDEIKGVLAAIGYHPTTIENYFLEDNIPRQNWIFEYQEQLVHKNISAKKILKSENLKRNKPIKLATVRRAINGAGLSTKELCLH